MPESQKSQAKNVRDHGVKSPFGGTKSVAEPDPKKRKPENSGEILGWSLLFKVLKDPNNMTQLMSAFVIVAYIILVGVGFLSSLWNGAGSASESLRNDFVPLITFALGWFRGKAISSGRYV
jgi:hypothetical protein